MGILRDMTLTRSPKRSLIAAVAVAALVPAGVVASAQGSTATAAKTKTVTLKGKKFHPATVTIKKGGKVKWVWKDGAVPHNVTSTGHKFKSSTLKTSGTFTVTFKKKGTFKYTCTIHPGMKGKVIVH